LRYPLFNTNSDMKILFMLIALSFCILCNLNISFGQSPITNEKQIVYLSGTDNVNTAPWEFFCTGGHNSGIWTTIEVPSCWEQQGFGLYNYGRDYYTYGMDYKYADEKGLYRHEFFIPEDWKGKKIDIVFEGSMTDTEVKINGKSAGEIHQGSFYRFRYNITDKLNFGQNNLLEVTVSKMSSNQSVNKAERYADYWIFGGIFRPVYLEAFPRERIERIAIDAKADGSFAAEIFYADSIKKHEIEIEIIDDQGVVINTISAKIKPKDSLISITTTIENPSLWTSEKPTLYSVNVYLKSGEQLLYKMSEKFGFRTVEVRRGDGIYLNGKRIKLKGINRQAFWPESGRTLSPDINLMDALLIKEMNMNAVRCGHYLPDKEFLEYCDSLGLYVIDELAGWHDAYDTDIGEKLVKEMVTRDVNHPSIILWSNGNEGGHNTDLDDDFSLYDPSNRSVIHAHHKPGNGINGIECNHYPSYRTMLESLKDTLIFMTTEFLHCQNDGGGGAGLNDYWNLMRNSERSGGGFLWALLDEGIMRTDRNNIIDVNGVNAPDGVLGPHREKEGSFYAIREIYSPVYIYEPKMDKYFNGKILVENRYEFTNLSTCQFKWKLINFHSVIDYNSGYTEEFGGVTSGIDIEPGEKGNLFLSLPHNYLDYDALVLEVYDPFGSRVMNWTWKIIGNKEIVKELRSGAELGPSTVEETDSTLSMTVNKITIVLSKQDGSLIMAKNDRNRFKNFGNGPRLVSGDSKFESLSHYSDDDGYIAEVKYSGDLKYARWKVCEDGWVEFYYEYTLSGEYNFTGISFDFPEDHVMSAKWLGNGPYRVWKNRQQGGTINVWENTYNNTQTGYFPWIYPEFKGYYSDISWMELNTVEGKFIIATDTDNLYVRLFDFYSLPGLTPHPELPVGDISFLEHIPPTGTKMSMKINSQPEKLGPESEMNKVDGTYNRTLYFYFGALKKQME
jgi:hypothetical protein